MQSLDHLTSLGYDTVVTFGLLSDIQLQIAAVLLPIAAVTLLWAKHHFCFDIAYVNTILGLLNVFHLTS
jgi:hypothetical protein